MVARYVVVVVRYVAVVVRYVRKYRHGTRETKMNKHVKDGDAEEFKRQVDRWRRFNGLEPLYERENKKRVSSIG